MNKKTLIIPALALLLGAAGCKNDDQPTATTSYSIPAINLITPLDGETAPYASQGSYKFSYDLYAQTVTVEGSNLMIDNTAQTFTAGPVRYSGNADEIRYTAPSGTVFPSSPWEVRDFGFLITDRVYRAATQFPGITGSATQTPRLVMNYRLDEKYKVATFASETTYKGETTTSYPAGDGTETFQTKDITYRVVIDIKEKKADVVLYDAQFAPKAPKLTAIGLKGLDVTYSDGAYTVSGSEIIPLVPEGSGTSTTPYPSFVFNSFSLTTTGADLTAVKADFQVAGRFKGSFAGSCIQEQNQ